MFQMFVWVGLLLAGKEKHGREVATYSLKEICSKYLNDVCEIVGNNVTFAEWGR